ncbi:MAG: glycosyltransferase family 2 protein [Acidiferrobacterales bacterium]|nr:glycosyltransferase family 2 protein [Acidiferrobacterales bacterium]
MTKAKLIKPSVSAVISAYNRPDFLRTALTSVLDQSYPVQEIIVVDDCSQAPLNEIVEEFSNASIVYERLQQNSGANYARNRGISLASSEWIAFLDDDDAWLSDKIAVQMQAIAANATDQKYIGSLCSYRFLESGKDRVWGTTSKVCLNTLKSGNPYCGASGLIARRDLMETTNFDESLPCGQDWDIYIRLASKGFLLYVDRPLFLYRRGTHESLTTKAKNMSMEDAERRLASVYKHKDWLGSKYFRMRVASQVLSYVFQKKEKTKWIKKSIELAGLRATFLVLSKKMLNRLTFF